MSKKNTKVENYKMQCDDVINISFQEKPKKRKGGPRMFYDDSFTLDVLTYMRPDHPEKPEAERVEDEKLRKKIKALLDKKKAVEKQKLAAAINAEDINNFNESFAAESLFDIMSPDPKNLSDDDDEETGQNPNPFSLQINQMENTEEPEDEEADPTEGMKQGKLVNVVEPEYDEGTSSSSSDG